MVELIHDADIVSAVTAYYDALYYGQPHKLDEAFAPDAVLLGRLADATVRLTVDEYRTLLKSRPSPYSKGESYALGIRDIRRCGGVATVELTTPLNGMVFTDYVSLVEREGCWRIVFKLYSYQNQREGAPIQS